MRLLSLAGGGVHALGLDYAGARAGLDLAGLEVTAALWDQIRRVEAGAVAPLNGAMNGD